MVKLPLLVDSMANGGESTPETSVAAARSGRLRRHFGLHVRAQLTLAN